MTNLLLNLYLVFYCLLKLFTSSNIEVSFFGFGVTNKSSNQAITVQANL